MKSKNLFLLAGLIVGLGLMPVVPVTAQTFTTLHSFTAFPYITNLDGSDPTGFVLSGNTLYGTAIYGGNSEQGTVFKVNVDGTGFTTLHSFTALNDTTNSDGARPRAGLILSGNTLYGTALNGGSRGAGTVFKVNSDGTGFTTLHSFASYPSEGGYPLAGLILSGNTLFGTTVNGGSSDNGTAFKVNTNGTGFATLHSFTARSGLSSANSDGVYPYGGLILSGNTLYGTASYGGSLGNGTVFAVKTNGTGFSTLHNFTGGSDGAAPLAGVFLSSNTLYGTAGLGGASGQGTVFKLNTNGTGFTVLHSFTPLGQTYGTNSDGGGPWAGLITNPSGKILYGTSIFGGSAGNGTVFAVNADGTGFTTLHSFTAGSYGTNSDGGLPFAGLLLSGNTLYGAAAYGGRAGNGTVFAVNIDGSGFTNLHSFAAWRTNSSGVYTNTDGARPLAGMVLPGNTLCGTALEGDSSGRGTVFAVHTDGTGFTNLHSFNDSDGAFPSAGLVLSGNTLYGTAQYGGSSGNGTMFALNTDGTGFTPLHGFTATSCNGCPNSDGANPWAGLISSGNALYGTAWTGGSSGNGTVFSLSLRPQLTIVPSGTNVILSWPISYAGFSYTGYYLEDTANLGSPTDWISVADTNAPVIINGQLRVTRPMLGPQRSYRL